MEEVKLELIKKVIDEKKGEDIQVYDVSMTSPLCSYIVVATMINGRHGRSLADEIQGIQEKMGETVKHIEGGDQDQWILVDLGDIIIHFFTEKERLRVDLETLIKKVNYLEDDTSKN